MIRKATPVFALLATACLAVAASAASGTAITLGGRSFTIGDWGYPYWSGTKEIYSAHTYKGRVKPHAKATIVIEKGQSSAGWDIKWSDIDRATAGTSCAEEERIIRDLAALAGLTVDNLIIGRCKTTWLQPDNRSLGTEGAFDFRRITPAIKPIPKLPSGNGRPSSPQSAVRFAPLGSGTPVATSRSSAIEVPPASLPVTPAQELAEIATRERLNREQAAFAARQVAENQAAKAAFDQATAERAATIARQQAEAAQREADYQAALAKWRADVEACKNGDITRCG